MALYNDPKVSLATSVKVPGTPQNPLPNIILHFPAMPICISLLYLLSLKQLLMPNLLNILHMPGFPRPITLNPIKHVNWHLN